MNIEILERSVDSKNWALVLFVAVLLIISYNKKVYQSLFSDFLSVFFTDRFMKTHKKENGLYHWFTTSFLVVSFFTTSFLLFIMLHHYGFSIELTFSAFLKSFIILVFFLVVRYLLEKIISIVLNIEEFFGQINFMKIHYRNFLGLLFFPIAMFLFFNPNISGIFYDTVTFLFIILHLFVYVALLKKNQKVVYSYFVYFILYFCIFEIVPTLFIFKGIEYFEFK